LMECLADIWSSHVRKRSRRLVENRRGNDWHTQQWLLHQIKAIEFPGVNTTRWFGAALG
jgi:hypothetical protein